MSDALLIRNALIVTMNADCQVLEGASLAAVDGKIAALGPDRDLLSRYPDARQLDAAGKVLMPGLINCHTHVPMSLFRGLADDRELMDWLTHYIFPAEARCLNPDFVRCGSRLAYWEMLRGGTTCVVDMYMFEDLVAEEAARLGMRGIFGQAMLDFPTPDFASWEARVEGTEAFLQRWKGHPTITAALAPHAPYTVSPEHLRQCQGIAEAHDCPMIIHLAETRSEGEQVQEMYQHSPVGHLDSLGLLTSRLIAAHVVWPSDPEIATLARQGVGVGHCPQSNMKLASGIAPVVKMLAAGVAVGLGTDGPASNNDLDMWQEMQTASLLQKVAQMDARSLTARQTLELATCGAARAAHLQHRVGSLEVGKDADMILVRLDGCHQIPVYDPVSQLAYTTRSSDVEHVFIAGRPVVEHGRVLGIDEAELRSQVEEHSRKVREVFR